MTSTFTNVFTSVMSGFRDAVLGIRNVSKLDSDTGEKRPSEPISTLARRRAEKMKQKDISKSSTPKVKNRIFLCCAWNGGVCWLSILVFNYALLPCIYWFTHLLVGGSGSHGPVWSWLGPFLGWTFSALWVLPLFVLSKIINCFWFQDIADAAYLKTRGRPQLPSISIFVADIVFSLLLQALFLIQGMLASFLPIYGIGQLISLVHYCILYSLYSFEYKWLNMGLEVHTRLALIESNWPYFVGFGLPLALLTAWPSSIVISGCVFSILFPLVIISANEAKEPTEPFEFPLRLFTPVVAVSNALFQHSVSKKSRTPSGGRASTPVKHKK